MKKAKVSTIDTAERFNKMAAALQNAQDFLNAYRVLQAHNRVCLTNRQQPIFTADVVNLTFGLELLLKALLYYEGKNIRGHKLNELFGFLSNQTQIEIKKAFSEHLIKTTGHDKDIFGLTFEKRLRQYSDTYQYWRYFHENKGGTFNSQFCENLAVVLNKIVESQLNGLRNA